MISSDGILYFYTSETLHKKINNTIHSKTAKIKENDMTKDMLSGTLAQDCACNLDARAILSSLCLTEEVENHRLLVSEKLIHNSTYLSSMPVRKKYPMYVPS